jgi:hypothetical protein
MLVLVLLVGGVCVVVESRRSRRCTELVVASGVSAADQNIGINKPKPSGQSRQDRTNEPQPPVSHLTPSDLVMFHPLRLDTA